MNKIILDINTVCYRALIGSILKNILYELFKGRKSNIVYFYVFGGKTYILNNNKDNFAKFDVKSYEGIFLGYSTMLFFRKFVRKISEL